MVFLRGLHSSISAWCHICKKGKGTKKEVCCVHLAMWQNLNLTNPSNKIKSKHHKLVCSTSVKEWSPLHEIWSSIRFCQTSSLFQIILNFQVLQTRIRLLSFGKNLPQQNPIGPLKEENPLFLSRCTKRREVVWMEQSKCLAHVLFSRLGRNLHWKICKFQGTVKCRTLRCAQILERAKQQTTHHITLDSGDTLEDGFWAHPPDGQRSTLALYAVIILVVHISGQSKTWHFHCQVVIQPGRKLRKKGGLKRKMMAVVFCDWPAWILALTGFWKQKRHIKMQRKKKTLWWGKIFLRQNKTSIYTFHARQNAGNKEINSHAVPCCQVSMNKMLLS